MTTRVGVIGSAQVGQVLAAGFKKHGYDVMIGSRDPNKVGAWAAANGVATGDFAETAKFGDIVVLAVGGNVAAEALALAGVGNLSGKTVIDATNPIGGGPPVNGVIHFFTGPNDSLMERLQTQVPMAHFVKAFSCVGNAWMINPEFPGGKPTMFICGNNDDAKAQVTTILDQFGWETEDMGAVEAARAIEPLCMLWCIPGFRKNQWSHAFKLLKK